MLCCVCSCNFHCSLTSSVASAHFSSPQPPVHSYGHHSEHVRLVAQLLLQTLPWKPQSLSLCGDHLAARHALCLSPMKLLPQAVDHRAGQPASPPSALRWTVHPLVYSTMETRSRRPCRPSLAARHPLQHPPLIRGCQQRHLYGNHAKERGRCM